MSYAYNCEMICDDCAEKIKAELDCKDSGDTNEYPQYASSDESDCPDHCGHCGVFLENALTTDGEDYVIQNVNCSLLAGLMDSVAVTEWMTYYQYLDYVEQCEGCGDYFDNSELNAFGQCNDCEYDGTSDCVKCGNDSEELNEFDDCPDCASEYD